MPNDGDRRHDHICKAISFWTWYGKCMTISPGRFSPMRKQRSKIRIQNDYKANIKSFEYDFYCAYSCSGDQIITSKLPSRKLPTAKCIKSKESSEVRPIIVVLSFTFQVGIAYESNLPNSSILGIYSTLSRYKMVYFRWESFRFIQGL